MHYVGIDLHKRFLAIAVEDDHGEVGKPRKFECQDVPSIHGYFLSLQPFICVIEASSSYRWLYELLRKLGQIFTESDWQEWRWQESWQASAGFG